MALLFQAGLAKIFDMESGMKFCLLTVITIGFALIMYCVEGKEGLREFLLNFFTDWICLFLTDELVALGCYLLCLSATKNFQYNRDDDDV